MATTETRLRKHQCIPFLDTTKGGATPSWTRIDKSTIFALAANPEIEEMDYICFESPVSEVDHYVPSLPQEIVLNAGNPMYEFVSKFFHDLPVGEDAKVPALICFPPNAENEKLAWKVDDCVLELQEYNTVDRKITFTLRLGGNITRGTYTITNGVPTFTPDA